MIAPACCIARNPPAGTWHASWIGPRRRSITHVSNPRAHPLSDRSRRRGVGLLWRQSGEPDLDGNRAVHAAAGHARAALTVESHRATRASAAWFNGTDDHHTTEEPDNRVR